MLKKILISNIGFGDSSPAGLKSLKNKAIVVENTEKKRFDENDFIEALPGVEILIAGTEKITKKTLDHAVNLKLIARVGVGTDNIDLHCAREKKISICYTPHAPSEAVPEFTLALILNLLKGIAYSDRRMHEKIWHRPMGKMLSSLTIGILGAGKIGQSLIQLIKAISPSSRILFYDPYVETIPNATKSDLKSLISQSDLLSLHLPLNSDTKNLINEAFLEKMKRGSYLVNTSRGEIIDEEALYCALQNKQIAGAALDVFSPEPYTGILTELDNCLLTSHIGSMTYEVRALMENQIAEDVLGYIKGQPLIRPVDGFNFIGSK